MRTRRFGDGVRLVQRWPAIDRWLYPVFAGLCVLVTAGAFYSSMLAATHGLWSAPLDDVFIHFDCARATARGYPLSWSEGNGYSSGCTSVTYSLVLALGYWVAARGMDLLVWAAVVACASTLVFLWCSAELFSPLGRWAKYVAPPAVLSLGALDWTLFSGMENALHLALWGTCLLAAIAVRDAPLEAVKRRAALLGVLSALLLLTRPESVVCAATFAVFVALGLRVRAGARFVVVTTFLAIAPTALVLAAQAVVNRVATGEWLASGAIVKLALNDPFMSPREKLDDYLAMLKYVVLRNTQHHFADAVPWGWLVPLAALVPLASSRLRAVAWLLWSQALLWLALVALNGQARWQNERYTMAAVAWLLLLAAMGLALLCSRAASRHRVPARLDRPARLLRAAAAAAIALLYGIHQAANLREQLGFFARASRNIREQQIAVGQKLRKLGASRVLVGDAGAILYASDVAGLDVIGLGGYKDLPFARAGVHGLGASLELIERMPRRERPDYLAIYPSWWGDLAGFFGRRVDSVAIADNVICGESEKVIYRADWSAFDARGTPRTLRFGERVVDELDVGDLVSEREHAYAFPALEAGRVVYRVLPETEASEGRAAPDLFDAGRVIPAGYEESATLHAPSAAGRLVLRTIAAHALEVAVVVDGRELGSLAIARTPTWSEPSIALPALASKRFRVELRPSGGELFDAHVWVIERAVEVSPPSMASPHARAAVSGTER